MLYHNHSHLFHKRKKNTKKSKHISFYIFLDKISQDNPVYGYLEVNLEFLH